jgi:predicted O-methyltransferase YrrM
MPSSINKKQDFSTMKSAEDVLHEYNVKGFLAKDEAEKLHSLALEVSAFGPCLELGSYCGLSTVYLGTACKEKSNSLYAIDHHRGSEEHQLGEEYHDPDLYDEDIAKMNSFKEFRKVMDLAELEEHVIPIVCASNTVLKHWRTPLGLVFIDGGHSEEMARQDCLGWSQHITRGGYLAVHDIFEKPEDGGQGPWKALQAVLNRGGFECLAQVNSLGILRKL